jgi:hypothetical protein
MTGAATSGESQQQSGNQLGGKILLAAICFGPPLAFFAWVSVRYLDWTVLLIPLVAVIGAAGVYILAKDFRSTWPEDDASDTKPFQIKPEESGQAISPERSKLYKAFDSVLAAVFVASVILVFSHIGRHQPGEHGILPIAIQAVLAIMVVGGIGLLLFGRVIAWTRSRNQRFE